MTRVAVAILRRNGKILVCQRGKGARYGLKWEFPGGKLEPNEIVHECLRRELGEELSVEVTAIERMEFYVSRYDDGGTYEVAYCFVSEFEGEPRNNVFEEIRWVTLDELHSLDILEGNRPLVQKLTHE